LTVPTGARIRMCESIAKLAKARKSKIAQDDTDHDPSNGRFTSGSGGSAKPAKKSDASNPDHKWGSWKEFNDDYVKALQKRNAAAREHDKATRTGQESPKTAAKLERAKAFADAHTNHPNRPSSSVTYNFNRPRIGQDSAVCRLVRARRPKVAQDADWDEGKHKRASNGQFGSGGGGSKSKSHTAHHSDESDRHYQESEKLKQSDPVKAKAHEEASWAHEKARTAFRIRDPDRHELATKANSMSEALQGRKPSSTAATPVKSDASSPDHKWVDWKEFNDDYTKALQKRNSAQRDHDKATRMGQESPKTASRLQKAEAFAKAHQDHPNRPASASTANFIRPR